MYKVKTIIPNKGIGEEQELTNPRPVATWRLVANKKGAKPNYASDLKPLLCWPKNVVKGCVSRSFSHATFDHVFLPSSVPVNVG